MDNPMFALLAPSLLLVPAMGLLSRIDGSSPVRQEIRRKSLHVLVGLVALSFPLFLTNGALVIAALGLALAWMLAVRSVPALRSRFGCVLHDAGRASRGELYFALSVAGLLLVATAPLFYVIPLLILTLADSAAAIVGRGWPRGRLPAPAAGKTLSGSVAFLVTAFTISAATLSWFTGLGPLSIFAVSLIVALGSSAAEAVSSQGLDNLSVPAIAWILLTLLLNGA